MDPLGGSHAQRDIFWMMLSDAAAKGAAGQGDRAEAARETAQGLSARGLALGFARELAAH